MLCALLNLRLRILQTTCPIEHGFAGRGIGVYAKVAEAFELILRAGHCFAQARLDLAGSQHFQRIRIQIGGEVLAFLNFIGVLFREKVFVMVHLGVYGVRGGDSVDRSFDLARAGGVAAAGFWIAGAMQLDDVAVGVFDYAFTLDNVAIL